MRILYHAPVINLTRMDRGDARHVSQVVHYLSKLGNQIYLVSSNRNKNLNSNITTFNCFYYFNHLYSFPGICLKIFSYFVGIVLGFLISTLVILRYKCDVIYIRNDLFPVAFLLKKFLRKPLIYEMNTPLFIKRSPTLLKTGNIRRRPTYKITLSLMKKMCLNSDVIMVVTEAMKDEVVDYYHLDPEKVIVNHNGYDPEIFFHKNRLTCRKLLNLEADKFYMVYVGSFCDAHDIEIMIEAMKIIDNNSSLNHFNLIMVGDGPNKIHYENKAKELGIYNRIDFRGRVSSEIVPFFINAGDVCLSATPKAYNGISELKIFEYLACKKPIVYNDTKGIGIHLKKHMAGLRYQVGNPEALVKTIYKIYKNKELADKMSINGFNLVSSSFTWKNNAERIQRSLTEVISKKTI